MAFQAMHHGQDARATSQNEDGVNGRIIMGCTRVELVHRLHDGELSSGELAAAETHIRECADCRALLADLRRLSQLISQATPAEMAAEAAERMHRAWHAARDRGVLRAASWLTAAAAAVLVMALLTSPAGQAEPGSRPPVWQTVAVTPPAGVHDEAGGDTAVTAQWMADDLLSSERR